MSREEKKVDSVLVTCTVSWKKTLKQACKKMGISMVAFISIAVVEKIKRDGLGEE